MKFASYGLVFLPVCGTSASSLEKHFRIGCCQNSIWPLIFPKPLSKLIMACKTLVLPQAAIAIPSQIEGASYSVGYHGYQQD